MRKVLFAVLLLSIAGCHKLARIAIPQQAFAGQVDPQTYGDAMATLEELKKDLPAYLADPMSRYERTEIAAVQADFSIVDQAKSGMEWLTAVDKLAGDFDTLAALDQTLQKEHIA